MEEHTISYDFDEETLGFEEPEKAPAKPLGTGEKISLAVLGFGILMFVLQAMGMPPGGTWAGFLLVLLPVFFGTASYFYLDFKGTVPGIKHDNIYFRGILNKGILGWLVGIVFTGFYIALYWFPEYLAGGIKIVNPALAGPLWFPGQQLVFLRLSLHRGCLCLRRENVHEIQA